jgi:hypothetical protein
MKGCRRWFFDLDQGLLALGAQVLCLLLVWQGLLGCSPASVLLVVFQEMYFGTPFFVLFSVPVSG